MADAFAIDAGRLIFLLPIFGRTGMIVTMSSLSDRITDSPEIYRQCFRDSNDAVAITDVDGVIVAVNHAFETLYGYTAAEVLGQTTALIKSEHSTRAMYGEMWSEIQNPRKGYWKGEVVNRRKTGDEVPILLSITPIRDGGQLIGYMGIAIDITERRRLEAFKTLYDKVMRHDLKAPLGAIITMGQALQEENVAVNSADIRRMVGRMTLRAEEMLAAINASLDLEKISHGTFRAQLETVALVPLLKASAETLDHLARGRRIDVNLSVDGNPNPVLSLDPIHARRAFDNLLKNAIEAAPAGSEVGVTVSTITDETTISFRNGGSPIPETVKATLFHPFSTYGKRGGTGLGLTGVKMMTEAMGGRVDYTSDEATGTTFSLYFRAIPESSLTPAHAVV